MLWNVDLWNEMERLRREVNRLFSDTVGSVFTTTYPLVNIYEDKDNVVVTAELPGMNKENINITYNEGILTISGKRELPEYVKKMTAIRQERATGSFEKTVRIPVKIEQEKITASFTDGILTITLPKAEEAKPKTIHIEAK
ncbi:MAG: Hsp20/alpha crystallin family protein [Chitinispirillaceae bacterium]|nr:Hsp20/alpha crystallin family protein [Chitinispirillaceae bacterium]